MSIVMSDFKRSKYLLVIPAILIMLSIYPIGINTHLSFQKDYNVAEVDTDGPATHLNHISSGFYHDYFGFSTFYSMITSVAYVPYIWARTSMLPPYDLEALDKRLPSLKGELTVISRLLNLIAALGILFISFYLTWIFCKTPLPPFLVSLMVALNPNLMVQSTVTYFESWSVFFVMLSALFFIKTILKKTNNFFWFTFFWVSAALAVSCHERMAGYYLFSGPFLIYKFFIVSRINKKSTGRALLLTVIGLCSGFFAYCFANSVFSFGFDPIIKYFFDRRQILDMGPDRFRGLLEFADKQFRCQRHAIWLTICNLGFIVPVFSICGLWSVWKKRFMPAIFLLLFPIGYHILSIGFPGWTMGRYVMGLTIFAALYAGLGISWCVEYAKKTNKMAWFWSIAIFALAMQLFFMAAVKVTSIYYDPYRVVESLIKDPVNKGKNIVVRGISIPTVFSTENNVTCEIILGEGQWVRMEKQVVITISDKKASHVKGNIYKREVRNPPDWLAALIGPRMCYLLVHYCPITIEWRDNTDMIVKRKELLSHEDYVA